ncbi:FixH family protein [Aquamicrobium sp. LC103]|uniref:FixH family protein n=1 Tax=Aquamicrobium sp. LC103 TaxID=1120658 RepID=UPI00063E8AF5|nr:FixH family protein [Aquamicrobium sp. LC103]TKT79123.1 auxin-binding protein [Aquamicrobium sp. LC103]
MAGKSRTILIVAAGIAAIVIAGMLAMHFLSAPSDDLDLSRSKASAAGLYRVSVAPEAEPLRQGPLHSWIVTVATPDGAAVEDARITVDGGMPQHSHGLPTEPQSTGHIGDGRYRIEGVRFNMGGWWVLKFAIEAPAGRDEAEFNVVL